MRITTCACVRAQNANTQQRISRLLLHQRAQVLIPRPHLVPSSWDRRRRRTRRFRLRCRHVSRGCLLAGEVFDAPNNTNCCLCLFLPLQAKPHRCCCNIVARCIYVFVFYKTIRYTCFGRKLLRVFFLSSLCTHSTALHSLQCVPLSLCLP